jgi:hypothetical protein
VPALRVAHGERTHEGGESAIVARPHQQMKVIGHQAVGQQSHIGARNRLNQHPLVRCRVVIAFERSPGERADQKPETQLDSAKLPGTLILLSATAAAPYIYTLFRVLIGGVSTKTPATRRVFS